MTVKYLLGYSSGTLLHDSSIKSASRVSKAIAQFNKKVEKDGLRNMKC